MWDKNLSKIANIVNKTINSFGLSTEVIKFGIENSSLSPGRYESDFDSVEDYVKYMKNLLKLMHEKNQSVKKN